jgi:hypothetical protein
MSIANEIKRIQTAKANIKTAIENKGVTIADDVTIDNYPEYITQIPAGAEITEPYAIYRNLSSGNYEECETFNMVGVPANFIRQNTSVKSVVFNEGVTQLYNASVFTCSNLTSVTLPSTLRTLNANALGSNPKLNNVVLPKAMVSINATSFLNCGGLVNINVESGFNANLPLPTCQNVSQESVSNIITNYLNNSGRTLTLHANVFANIPESEIMRANEKGLTIAEA